MPVFVERINTQKVTSVLLLVSLLIGELSVLLMPLAQVFAAQVQVDATASTAQLEHQFIGAQTVFTSDQVGYKFYVDSAGTCVYSKTTNGGTGWGAPITIDGQTDCFGVSVWYDQWTPDDTGTYIHIVTADPGNDDLWYNRLDTSTDTRLLGTTPISVVTNSGQGGSLAAGGNTPTITKGTDGTVYAGVSDNTDSYVVECSANCNLAASWAETGTNPMDLQPDFSMLLPLSGGDILLINRDISADDMRSKVWNNSGGSWSGTWTAINSNALENATYDPAFAAAVNAKTGDVYLAYVDNATTGTLGGNNDDVRVAKYSGGSWTNGTDVITNTTMGLTGVALSIDANNGGVYVAYTGRTTPATANTGNVYWASSTAAMSSWGAQQGPVNTTADNLYGLDLNSYNQERIYVTWYGITPDDIFGDTIADITPITVVSASGSQTATARASTTNFYVGGKFVIKENVTSRNVTDITITESGSVDGTLLDNVRLYYDLDTSNPYDCASESYGGSETQFGSTDTNGFSGTNGTAAFTSSVSISKTQTMCVYTVLDIPKAVADGSTLEIEIASPPTDVLVSGGVIAVPEDTQALSGTTDILDSDLTQTHYHWRYDDGNETAATSRTSGNQDTALAAIQKTVPARLRFGISNEGSTSTFPTAFRLEYATNPSTCDLATGWTDVGASSDEWDMYNSSYIADGANSTNISNAIGGVDDENSVFLSTNGGLRDTSSQTGSLTLLPTNWMELEYSILPTASAVEGNTYCFRVTNAGEELPAYTNYPKATIAADVTVTATGTQVSSIDIPQTNTYIGGAFRIVENSSSRNVTDITLTEKGTVDASTGLGNVKIYYDLDTSVPYDCASESYAGGEVQFGSTDTDGFSAANGTSTFSGSAAISTTQTMCAYVVVEVTDQALNAETIDIEISSGSSDVVVSGGGTVSPSTALDITGSSTLNGGIVTLTHYHWRNDDGTESGATSATGDVEDTPLLDFAKSTPTRLRVQLSNEGATTSVPRRYGLEYGVKTSSCEAITVWSDADGGGVSWDMYDSGDLTNGADTTNIGSGGALSDPGGKSFLSVNGGVRDTESFTATTTLTETQFTELEYSITSTEDTPYEATFCFRVTQNGAPLLQYDTYPELTIMPLRDFKIQRGEEIVTGTGVTLTAGVDYVAPSSASAAFVRITNSHYTGAGKDTLGGNQNSDDYGAYISNPGNIMTSFTISRDNDSINNSYVAWEIVEYIGPAGGDNEMIVRDQAAVSPSAAQDSLTASAVSGVADDNDIVVFITGQTHRGGNRTEAFSHQFTSEWNNGTDQPTFRRGNNGGNQAYVSYAVVEFTGYNWRVQRVEHSYSAVNTTETESITAINSISRAFLHTQKRYGVSSALANVGHQVWISSIGAVSFFLDSNASTAISPVSVAWVIENTQTAHGAMFVQQASGNTSGGTEPMSISLPIATPVNATNNTSLFVNTSANETGDAMPRPIAGVYLTSTSTYQLWRSDTSGGGVLSYRTEIVQWPAADLAVRQNYYRFYDDNDDLTPSDPWPPGASNLGENTSITAVDEPLSDGDHVRIRMTARIDNATLPAGFLQVKLQYGALTTTCSAIETWTDVGVVGSGSIWRGYNAAGITDGTSVSSDPPSGGDLLISVADVAGRYVESNPADANEFPVLKTEEIEYDWHIEQNGAPQRTTYCFRMIKTDETPLDAYFNYPQLRTEGYSPAAQNWRWYDDEGNETPSTPLGNENFTPTSVVDGDIVKLRVTIAELKNLSQINARFKLQYSESAAFTIVNDVVSTTSCNGTSIWCYADGAGVDNELITTSTLSDADSCVAGVGNGCGVHNEAGNAFNGFTHGASRSIENEFTITYSSTQRHFGKVYYFRLYDMANSEPVAVNTSYSMISLGVDPTTLSVTVNGVNSGVSVAGITTDVTTNATSISFGSLPVGTSVEAAQEVAVSTNATEGYQLLFNYSQLLSNGYGDPIADVTSTNATPQGWATACSGTASCFGYHTTDATLWGGSTRFSPLDSYAALSTLPEEIMYNSASTSESHFVVYRTSVDVNQPAGDYITDIVYIALTIF
jgi:hypothetical protein